MPVFLLIVACALWGLSFPLVRALHLEQEHRLPGTSSEFFAAWLQVVRFSLAALLLTLPLLRRSRITWLEVRQGLMLALWGGLGMGLQADALAHTDASTSAFLTQAYCVFLPLWLCLRLRVAPNRRTVLATLMVLLGGAILSGLRPDNLKLGRGEVETLIAALLFTFQILTLENPRYAPNRGLAVTFMMCVGVVGLFIPITLALAPRAGAVLAAGASPTAMFLVLLLAVLCTVGAYLLMNIYQRRISATEAGLIYTTEPLFTGIYVLFLPALLGTMVGARYPNESLTIPMLLGAGLIIAANLAMQWKRKPHPPAIAPAP